MIRNLSNSKRLIIPLIRLNNLKDKVLGAIKFTDKALIFETRYGIHTFFVREDLDVVVLDSKNKVMKLKKNLAPNRVFLWSPKYKTILELPSGSIDILNLEKGNIMEFL